MSLRERLSGWVAAAKRNERRWMLTKDLEWIISTTTTVDELMVEVQHRLDQERGRAFEMEGVR